jgi:hypothetical protein
MAADLLAGIEPVTGQVDNDNRGPGAEAHASAPATASIRLSQLVQVREQGSTQGSRQAEVFGTEASSWLIGVFAHDIGSLEIDSKSLETGIFLSAFS